MNKELQKLLKQINDKKNEVKSLVNDGKLDKAKAAKEELKELQNRFDLLYDLDEEEQDDIKDKVNNGTAKQVGGDVKPDKKNIVKSFVNIVKAGFLHKEADEADIKVYKDALTSDTTAGSEGEVGIGVTIPEDIRTDIIELRRSSDNLEQYVNVEGVTTKTGTRNIEVDAESTPFDNVDEAADFPEMDEPEFYRLSTR
jgi:HK97 family phage major capsid protein